MRRFLRGLVLGLLGCCIADAAAADGESSARQQPQPAVWVVRDSDSTLYLFGTLHLRRAGADWGGPVARQALADAGTVWLEIGAEDADPSRVAPLLRAIGFDRTRPLSTRVDTPRLRQLREVAGRMAIPFRALDSMKPWLAATVLAVHPMQQAGYDAESGVDRMVSRAAVAARKEMRTLESAEQQFRFLDGLSEAAQLTMLYESLDHDAESVTVLRSAEAAWEVGDLAELQRLLIAPMGEASPELHEALFSRRNRDWAEKLAGVLAGSGVDFVAVGSGHLGGEGGVEALLAARGFQVERLTPVPP